MSNYLLGIDLGTTGCKALLIDENGSKFATATAPISTIAFRNIREQNTSEWRKAVTESTRKVTKNLKGKLEGIISIGVTGHFPSFVPLLNGKEAGNAILYSDLRVKPERILRPADLKTIEDLTGLPREIFPSLTSFKLSYLRRKGVKFNSFLPAKDYIRYLLTSEFSTDWLEAWWTGLFSNGKWSHEILEMLGLEDVELPLIRNPGEVAGELTREASRMLGLKEKTPVATGTIDGMAAFIGGGPLEPGDAVISSGSTDIIAMMTLQKPKTRNPSFYSWPYFEGSTFVLYSSTASSGLSVQFYLRLFNTLGLDIEGLTRRAAKRPPGSLNLLFLPYLQGEYAPFFSPSVRGALFGLDLTHDTVTIFRAFLEGISFSDRHVLEEMQYLGQPLKRIRIGGGGSANALWNEIRASVLGVNVEVLKVKALSALGAAILAGQSIGLFRSLKESALRLIRTEYVVKPRPDWTRRYDKLYRDYLRLSSLTRSFYRSSRV
ncbi:MAG: xylulokinase [Infirmifilum sp.]|uniref:xylulokinase n=1 Tax=Infirmifilum TaxID=2856573 RepID=UPI000B2010C4|nr:FGGY family carbohydrate kinase [Infirmifilum uzonense]